MCYLRRRPLPGQLHTKCHLDSCLGLALDLRTVAGPAAPAELAIAAAPTDQTPTAASATLETSPPALAAAATASTMHSIAAADAAASEVPGAVYAVKSGTPASEAIAGYPGHPPAFWTSEVVRAKIHATPATSIATVGYPTSTSSSKDVTSSISSSASGSGPLSRQNTSKSLARQQQEQGLVPSTYWGSAAWSIHVAACDTPKGIATAAAAANGSRAELLSLLPREEGEEKAMVIIPRGGQKTGRKAIEAAASGLVKYEEPLYPASAASAASIHSAAAAAAAGGGGGGGGNRDNDGPDRVRGGDGSRSSSHGSSSSAAAHEKKNKLGVLGTSPWMLPYAWNPELKQHEWEAMCAEPGVLEEALAVGAGRVRGALKAVGRDERFTAKMLKQVDDGVKAPASAQVQVWLVPAYLFPSFAGQFCAVAV